MKLTFKALNVGKIFVGPFVGGATFQLKLYLRAKISKMSIIKSLSTYCSSEKIPAMTVAQYRVGRKTLSTIL